MSGRAGDTRVICAASAFVDFHFTARHCWGFPLYSAALFGISTLPHGTIRDSHFPAAGRKKESFQRFNRHHYYVSVRAQ